MAFQIKKIINILNICSGGKNNFPPSPEESEYFYDDYVDYPYNETLLNETKINTVEPTTAKPSSHYISGDTPTIYAAPKNKTKNPDAPKEIPGSPSSSGFTFFGLPLPSINLNGLLGNGRKEEQQQPATQSQADRKAGIVTSTSRGTGRGKVFPPTLPEIQTGGFVPVTPGYGGFKPMLSPASTTQNPPERITTITAQTTVVKPTESTAEATKVTTTIIPQSTNSYLLKETQFSSMGHPVPSPGVNLNLQGTTTELSINRSEIISKTHTKTQIHPLETENDSEENNSEKIDAEIVKEIHLKSQKQQTPNGINGTNYAKNSSTLQFQSYINSETFEDTFQNVVDNVSVTPPTYLQGTKDVPTTSTSKEAITETPKKENTATPLTSLLIPGGQQPHFRPPGRSTITKVVSPHASASAPLLSSMQVSDEAVSPSSEFKEELITEGSAQNLKKNSDSDTSWYFTNYNKTNLEPFVGASVYNRGSGIEFSAHMVVLVVCLTLVF